MKINKIIEETRDETAILIAEMFDVSESYVRKIVSGSLRSAKKESTKERLEQIRRAYRLYKSGKNELIKSIEETIKI